MNLEQLIDHFNLATDSIEGLEQLRNVILHLAVRGKLTNEYNFSENAKSLFNQILEERNKFYKKGNLKTNKKFVPKKLDKLPYTIPKAWLWCHLGDIILKIYGGSTPSKSNPTYWDGEIYWASVKDLNDSSIYLEATRDRITREGLKKTKLVPSGNIIVCTRMGLGKINITNVETAINQDLKAIILPTKINKIYFYYYYRTLQIKGSGMTVSGIKQAELLQLPFALPPHKEQAEIVQKIESLFAQIDQLEQKIKQDHTLDDHLQIAVLADLQSAKIPEESRQSWKRLTEHFEQIYRKPEHIDQLKQAILNEAVRGRLVPQNPNDEPAEILLERIKEEKQRLYEEGEIRKPKELPVIKDEEIPFELPKGWVWCRLDLLTKKVGSGKTPRGGSKNYTENGIKFIRSQNVWNNGLKLDNIAHIPVMVHTKMISTEVKANDILLNITGASIGRCAVVPEDFDKGNVNQHVCIIRLINNQLNKYLHKYLISSTTWQLIMEQQVGISREGLSKTKILKFPVPIPPLNEQKRIIRKVEELFDWCDELKEKLSQSQKTDKRLLEALVNDALKEKPLDVFSVQ